MEDSEMIVRLPALLAPALLLAFEPLLAFAQQTPNREWPGPWHAWGGGEFWWIFPLFMLFMIALCFAVFLVGHRLGGGYRHWAPWPMMDRPSGSGHPWGDPTYPALKILNERFARGEIEKPEYEEKKAAILSSGLR